MKNRILWIDSARGLAILLVILGHCIGNVEDPINRFILSFHMPFFFFLSGLCAKKDNLSFTIYIKKKIKSLLVPQLVLGSINCLLEIFEKRTLGIDWMSCYTSWFLLVLFYISILWYFISRSLQKKYFSRLCILLFIVGIALDYSNLHTTMRFEIIPMALCFYLLGQIIKDCDFPKHVSIIRELVVFFALPLIVICSYWNRPVTMYANNYGNAVLFLVSALLGMCMLSVVSNCFDNNILLNWIGRNSIIFYVLHQPLIKTLHYLGRLVFPDLEQLNYLYPANWHYYIIALGLLIPMVYICEKYLWFMFGKSKK